MKLLKTKQPQPQEASPEALLAERIKQIMAEAEAVIEAEVQARKAGDAKSLPIDWVRMNLRALTGGACNCKCALKILENTHRLKEATPIVTPQRCALGGKNSGGRGRGTATEKRWRAPALPYLRNTKRRD